MKYNHPSIERPLRRRRHEVSDDGLQEIVGRLQSTRMRLIAGRLFEMFAWAMVTGLLVRALLEVAAHVGAIAMEDGTSTIVAGSVLAFVSLAGAVRVWRRSPDLIRVAAMADREQGLQERLSTAVELLESGGARTAVAAALLADVSNRASTLRTAPLLRRPRRREGKLLGVAVVSVLFLNGLPFVITPSSLATSREGALSSEARTATAVQLQRASALVRRDAEERQDAGLRALAQDLESLRAAIEQGHLADEVIVAELQRLAGGLAAAYGMSDAHSDPARLGPMNEADGEAGAWGERSDASTTELVSNAHTSEVDDAQEGDIERALRSAASAIDDVVSQLEAASSEAQQGSPAIRDVASTLGIGSDVRLFDYDEMDPELQARLDASRRILFSLRPNVPLGGEMGGAGDGASIQPGAGSQSLFGDEDGSLLDWDASSSDDVELPFDEFSTRRIRFDAPPEEQLSTVESAARSGRSWLRFEEQAIPRGFIAQHNRGAVSRYFLTSRSVNQP